VGLKVSQRLNDKAADTLNLPELLRRLPHNELFFGVIFLAGVFVIANIIISYIKVLIKKCEELGCL
jgi:hypothetical protein